MRLRPSRRVASCERTLIRQIFDAAPPDAINLGLGEPDLPTPPSACLGGISAIALGQTGYGPTAGTRELRAAVANEYPALAEGPDQVLITVGSQEAMFLVCLTLLDPGDDVLYPDPGYPAYPVVAKLVGARGVPYPLRPEHGFRLVAEDVLQRLSDRTRLVIVTEPSNPTGAVSLPDELEALARGLADRGIPWVADEIYSGFVYDRPFVSLARFSPEGGVVISGLSKDMSMTGWRIGWIVGPREWLSRAVAAHQYLVTCASRISQAAALAAFSPAGRADRSRFVEGFRRRRETMALELGRVPQVRVSPPDGAFYFFVDARAHGPSLELSRRILERCNVITIPGVAFGRGGEGFLRLSFAAAEDTIREGVGRVAAELRRG